MYRFFFYSTILWLGWILIGLWAREVLRSMGGLWSNEYHKLWKNKITIEAFLLRTPYDNLLSNIFIMKILIFTNKIINIYTKYWALQWKMYRNSEPSKAIKISEVKKCEKSHQLYIGDILGYSTLLLIKKCRELKPCAGKWLSNNSR